MRKANTRITVMSQKQQDYCLIFISNPYEGGKGNLCSLFENAFATTDLTGGLFHYVVSYNRSYFTRT